MPELPEVETTRRGISPHIKGKTISKVVIRNHRLRWPIREDLPQLLQDQPVTDISRRAKYLMLETPAGTLILHLGMSGSLRVVQSGDNPGKHDHLDLVCSDGTTLRLHDPRRFGAAVWTDEPFEQHALLEHLGPEPLSDNFNSDRLSRCAKGKSRAVKLLIMDNQVVVGVGNIYANEALFMAGIRPDRPAGKISAQRYERLAGCIKRVLANAIEKGGTTLKDFVGGDGKPGYFQIELAVYGHGGEPCPKCAKPLAEIKLGQRTTVFCKSCQR